MATNELAKPVLETNAPHFDYRKCRDYLQAKYGYDERDYAGRHAGLETKHGAPYLDFWHWVVDNYGVRNGCYITFTRDKMPEIREDWVREIYGRYMDEFADARGELRMWSEW